MKNVGVKLQPLETLIEALDPEKGGQYGGALNYLKLLNWEAALDDHLQFFDWCYVKDGPDGTVVLSEGLKADVHTAELVPGQREPRADERLANHKYFWRGVRSEGSVTGWIDSLYDGFDKEGKSLEIAQRASTWSRADNKYYMGTRVERFPVALQAAVRAQLARKHSAPARELVLAAQALIKEEWTTAGAVACAKGSGAHMSMEMFYNNMYDADAPRFQLPEFHRGLQFHVSVVQALGWTPWRTEMCFYSEQYGALCGMADMLYKTRDGKVVLADWKTNKAVTEKARRADETFHAPLQDLPVCKLSKFTVQLNVYALMLEHALGAAFRPERMIVVWLCDKQPSYVYWDVADLRARLHPMLLERGVMRNFLRRGKKKRAADQSATEGAPERKRIQPSIDSFFGGEKKEIK